MWLGRCGWTGDRVVGVRHLLPTGLSKVLSFGAQISLLGVRASGLRLTQQSSLFWGSNWSHWCLKVVQDSYPSCGRMVTCKRGRQSRTKSMTGERNRLVFFTFCVHHILCFGAMVFFLQINFSLCFFYFASPVFLYMAIPPTLCKG